MKKFIAKIKKATAKAVKVVDGMFDDNYVQMSNYPTMYPTIYSVGRILHY